MYCYYQQVHLDVGAFTEIVLDVSAPDPGSLIIGTSERLGEEYVTPKTCQRSSTTMAVEFSGFDDPESGIERYDINLPL